MNETKTLLGSWLMIFARPTVAIGCLAACSAPRAAPPARAYASAPTYPAEAAPEAPLPPPTAPPPAPEVALPFLRDVVHLSVGTAHVCTVDARQRVACWGDNATGQLGIGLDGRSAPTFLTRPHVVGGLPPITSVAAGGSHTCALDAAGAVYCWGSAGATVMVSGGGVAALMELHGEGLGRPVRMPLGDGQARVIALAGEGDTACAAFAGDVRCWRTMGLVPSGAASVPPPKLTIVPLADVTALSVFGGKACAIAQGEVRCWSVYDHRPTPAKRMRGDTSAPAKIALGTGHACVASTTGELRCWQMPIDDFWKHPPERDVRWPKRTPTIDVAVGDSPICTASHDGKVDCFLAEETGLTDQAVARSWATKKLGPHPIAGIDTAVAVGLGAGRDVFGYGFGCALRALPDPEGAQVFCWGDNESGQLGTGTQVSSRTAMPVLGAR